jgi:hypothetical protein
MNQGMVGLKLDDALIGGGGLIVALERLQGDAQIEVAFGVARIKGDGAAESARHVLMSTQGQERGAEIMEVARLASMDAEGLADQIHRHIVTPDLMGEHSEQVQGVWIVRVDAQDLPIDRFGLR